MESGEQLSFWEIYRPHLEAGNHMLVCFPQPVWPSQWVVFLHFLQLLSPPFIQASMSCFHPLADAAGSSCSVTHHSSQAISTGLGQQGQEC